MNRKELLITVCIFFLALTVRFVYLYENSANPSFTAPTVDSGTYDRIARTLASGKPMNYEFFWQPFFYPVFLAGIYAISNSSIVVAKIVQFLLGAITCVLVYRLGKKIFDSRIGIIAAVITAFYGPLIYFEGELLANCWSTFWSIALLLLLLETASSKKFVLCFFLGLCGALAVITRPTFLPFFALATLWLVITFYIHGDTRLKSGIRLSAILIGFTLVTIPVSFINLRVTGHFGFMPATGGLNLYIGNNPNYTDTVTVRPGWGWEELTSLPQRNGVVGDMWAEQKYFNKQVTNFVTHQPLLFIKGLAYKTIEFVSSREIPRNTSIYLFRKWSHILSALVWQKASFGFPFAVFLPFAILGLVSYWRQFPAPFKLFLIFYPLAIILVFVSARYRIEIIPVASVAAAAGIISFLKMVADGNCKKLIISAICGIAIILLSVLPGPFPEELPNFEAELYANVGASELLRDQYEKAELHLRKSLELAPDAGMAQSNLGTALFRQNKTAEALEHCQKALEYKPDSPELLNNLAVVLEAAGNFDDADRYYQKAIKINPNYAITYYNLGNNFYSQKKYEQALENFKKAVKFNPNYDKAWLGLGWTYYQFGKMDESTLCFEKAYKIDPDYGDVRYHLAWLYSYKAAQLIRQNNPDDAEKLLHLAIKFYPADPKHYIRMSQVLAAKGRLNEAISTLENAIASLSKTANKEDVNSLRQTLETLKQYTNIKN